MAMRTTSLGIWTIRFPLQAEHDHNREKERDKGNRTNLWNEMGMIPILPSGLYQYKTGEHPGDKRNTEIDKNALRKFSNAHMNNVPFKPKKRRQDCDEDPGVNTVEKHLENTVEGYKASSIFSVAFCYFIPYNDSKVSVDIKKVSLRPA